MAVGISSRAVALLLTLLVAFTDVALGDDREQLLPTETPQVPLLLTDNVDHNRLILTAGTQETTPSNQPRPHVKAVSEGTSSRRVKGAAIEALGLGRLPWQNQQLVRGIVDDVSIFRRLPAYQCEVDPKVHDYFVHHPDVAVSIWRTMGISQLQMWPTGDWSYGMDTKDGTTGTINVLYRSRESCLIVCNGMFKSPYLQKPIAARSVIHLRTSFSRDPKGKSYATHHADMFVAFPSQKVETVAKLISPVSNVIVDRNFQEISLFLHVMWLAMGQQPGWVEQIAGDMDGVSEELREELLKLTAEMYVAQQIKVKMQAGQALTLDAIRPPTQQADTRPVSRTQTASGDPSSTIR